MSVSASDQKHTPTSSVSTPRVPQMWCQCSDTALDSEPISGANFAYSATCPECEATFEVYL